MTRLAVAALALGLAACSQSCPTAPVPAKPAVAIPAPQSALWPTIPNAAVKQPATSAAKPAPAARAAKVKKPKAKAKAAKPNPKRAAVAVAAPWWCGMVPASATENQIITEAAKRNRSVTRAQARACVASKKG